MYKLVLLIALVPTLTLATENVKSCSGENFPNSVEVLGCDAAPCLMERGTTGQTLLNITIRKFS